MKKKLNPSPEYSQDVMKNYPTKHIQLVIHNNHSSNQSTQFCVFDGLGTIGNNIDHHEKILS